MAQILRSAAEEADWWPEDCGLLRVTGQIAWSGELPRALILALREQGVPYDFVIESESGRTPDQRGYWRPGMEEPRMWLDLDGKPVVWVSGDGAVLCARGTWSERPALATVMADEAEPIVVPDLRTFPDPRAGRAANLRSEIQVPPATCIHRRRFRL
jgi:hypothetical protein